jgi:putative hydrolases of HD superfamily
VPAANLFNLRNLRFIPISELKMSKSSRLNKQIKFLVEADKLKSVLRRNYVMHEDRRENSAEHSWHVALIAIVLAEHSNDSIDVDRVAKMLIIHDIVEVDAGDTFIYDASANKTKAEREEKAAKRLFGLLPEDQGKLFRELWEEFEARSTVEAKFANAVDRFVAVLHNYETRGRGWQEHGIKRHQVLALNEQVKIGSATIWEEIQKLVNAATQEGILGS